MAHGLINSLGPRRRHSILKYVIFKHVVTATESSFCEIALSLISTGLIDDQSISYQIVSWCGPSQCLKLMVSPVAPGDQKLGWTS